MNWIRCTRSRKCPICDHDGWCSFTGDGRGVKCMRVESERPTSDGGWMHNLGDGAISRVDHRIVRADTPSLTNPEKMLANWRYSQNGHLAPFAATLGVSKTALESLGCVWAADHRAFAFPMRDGQGRVIGIRLRNDVGDKWAVRGSKQGLFLNFPAAPVLAEAEVLPRGIHANFRDGEARESTLSVRNTDSRGGRETLLIVEGPTDAAAAIDLGYAVIGRPACMGCEQMICDVVRKEGHVTPFIIADNDAPGQRGAAKLQAMIRGSKVVTLPCKDLRQFKNQGGTKIVLNAILTAVV